ncbi:autophagy-related protein 2 homolog B-like [Mytilus californianus]|uniref:autophagy-related protein 2 homolog B-like n=1 Tax=Mytilus californianus TaxID=6549 RepID=UPI002245730E|nr:autophagy-related protein 2 homolog B-like [Mytilus californianus]
MPWSFPWSDYVKKRACRYLLQHYLGQFLKEKLTLDQLSVNLSSGKGNITQLDLNVESLNEALESSSIPLEVVDGFIHEISVSVPWTCLIQKSTELEITGLEITLQPKQRNQHAGGLESMLSSTMSMTSSLKIAEDCLKRTTSEESLAEDTSQPYEGVQIFAQTIDSVLSRVKVTLNDTVIRLEHLPMQAETGVALEIRIKRIEYFDDLALDEGSSVDDVHKWEPSAISHKNISMEGIQILCDEFTRLSRQYSSPDIGSSPSSPVSPSVFHSTSSTLSSVPPFSQSEPTSSLPSPDSDPIQVAVITGKNTLKLKVKQGEGLGIQGPKVEMECELGAVHILLCPKQFHALWALADGLSSPATSDRKMKRNRSKSKPMSPDDYRKIEEDLQRQLQSGRIQHQRQEISHFTAMHDIMTGSFGGEDQFYSVGQHKDMESSFTSQTSYSTVSTVKSGGTENRKPKDPMKKILDDPSAEFSHYRLRLAFFSVALLHDNPCSKVEHGQTRTQENNIKDLSTSYFQRVFTIATAARGDMKSLRKSFVEVLKYDHIRLLGKPLTVDCTEKTIPTHHTMTVDVTVGMFEMVECLFDRRDKTAMPTYTELLVFNKDGEQHATHMYSSMHGSAPCIKATITYMEQTKGSRKISPRTDVNVTIGACESEIDVTIIDRVNSLLSPPPRSRSCSHTGNIPMYTGVPDTFSQTLEDGANSSEMTTDIKVNSSNVKLYIRFPIPDLRPQSQVDRFPWWKKNLREEMVILKLSDFRFITSIKSQQSVLQMDVICKEVHGSFLLDPNHEPEPFAYACGDNDNEDGFNSPQISLKLSKQIISLLDEQGMNSENNTPLDSLNGACQFDKVDPSPFSNKKSMYGKDDDGSKEDTHKHVSEEMVIPGDRDEMMEFQDTCINNTEITLDIYLPMANCYLPSKNFYEVLYNRFNNDLLLWEPVAPSPLPTQDQASGSIQPFDLSCYPQVLQDNFELAKSAIQYESSDEEEDYSYNYYSIHDSKYPRKSNTNSNQPCKMCLLLRIDKGKLTTSLNSKAEDSKGAAVAVLQNANLFTVSHFKGDPSLQYICFISNQVELYHSGTLSASEDFSLVPTCENISYIPACLRKCKKIYPTETGVNNKLDLSNEDMLSVAVRIKKDTTAINDLTKDEKVKEFLVSLGVHGATLRHKIVESGCSWISQVLDLLDAKDYEVLGYIAPKVLTELHVHLWKCSVDYRPLQNPTKALLKAESFSISSNIVAESSTSLLRFVLDDASLFLSQSSKPVINLQRDYVCVADLERFELALRMNDGKEHKFPKTDFKVSTNRLNIRTCSDSCKALMDLIRYFATDGDLDVEEAEDLNSTGTSDDIISTDNSQQTIDDDSEDDRSGLSESRLEQLHTLVEDAMQESGAITSPDKPESSAHRTEVFFTTEGGMGEVPHAGMMRPIVISASADSVASTCSGVSENFSDDEDFCIIDDPGIGIAPKDGEPCVRVFTTDPIEIKDNHFSQPTGKTDLLKAPDHYPTAEYRYTLKELTVVWYMYGGRDFSDAPNSTSLDKDTTMSFKPEKSDSKHQIRMGYRPKLPGSDRLSAKVRGGPGRDHDVLMELQLTKIRMQHETYPSHTEQASRQILVISDVEIRDKLTVSSINKLLYQYSSETLPKQTNSNMVLIKAIHVRPDPSINSQECSLRISVQPLRLNVDQDSLFFMRDFFTELSGGTVEQVVPMEKETESKPRSRTPSGASAPSPPQPVMTVGLPEALEEDTDPQELLMMFDEVQDLQMNTSSDGEHTPRPCSSEPTIEPSSQPIFIKSFIFSPDVPIRLDYHGKKRVLSEHGTLVGLLSGLAQLNCSELQLKKLTYRHGLLGLDKLVTYCINEWLTDIKKNQLASVLGGVGPMHSFVQLAQGVKDLFWLPVEQYRKDGRIVRGLQRGASSFSTSTAMAFLELTNRVVQSVQYVAELTYDMVSPGPSVRIQGHRRRKKYGRKGQPSDLREGLSNAYVVLREGLSEQAQNFMESANTEHEQKGVTGVVGGVMRQIPSAVISPLIIGPDALSNVLGGARNQLRPDAKKEEEEKWKLEPT